MKLFTSCYIFKPVPYNFIYCRASACFRGYVCKLWKSSLLGNCFCFLISVASFLRNSVLDSSVGCAASAIIEMTKNSTDARIASGVFIGIVGSLIFSCLKTVVVCQACYQPNLTLLRLFCEDLESAQEHHLSIHHILGPKNLSYHLF